MRIQHNIPALSAYRNYTRNVSMVNKNLEKLSSGYRINRAGDDAAGLAISEKMRIQISGLEQAQTNAKAGINLVQTAEGALTEVHDMLNRMYTLAEQSANGTYADDVDREQLQKEINSLRTEIDRIADATNYNGIKLLDGSLSSAGVAASEGVLGDLPAVGETLGEDTVVHKAEGTAGKATKFSVDLHNLSVKGAEGSTFKIKIGTTELTGTLKTDASETAVGAADIAKALAGKDDTKITFVDADGNAVSDKGTKIGGGLFDAEVSETRVTFTQQEDDTAKVNPDMKVTVDKPADGEGVYVATATSVAGGPGEPKKAIYSSTVTVSAAPNAWVDNAQFKIGGTTYKVTTAGTGANEISVADANDAEKMAAFLATKLTAPTGYTLKAEGSKLIYTADNAGAIGGEGPGAAVTAPAEIAGIDNSGAGGVNASNMKFTFGTANADQTGAAAAPTAGTVTFDFTGKTGADVIGGSVTVDGKTYSFYKTGEAAPTGEGVVAVEVAENAADTAIASALKNAADTNKGGNVKETGGVANTDAKVTFTHKETGEGKDLDYTVGKAGTAASATVSGEYNVSTTVLEKKGEASPERLASTHFTLGAEHVADGNVIRIGKESYTFTTNAAEKDTDGKVYIGDLDAASDEFLSDVAERLTLKAEENTVYSVGHDGTRITLTEKANADGTASALTGDNNTDKADGKNTFDLRTLEGIKQSLGFTKAGKSGSPLTLQIGDTAEDFNKISVSIKDMHAAGIGIAGIDISTQEGASKAMDAIKNATNIVSDVRGDLGALQNRLDHTINNLSVTQENITDAESTIRDVDIAKEMMAYTKNNILVQSAQAMLAQANQLPQGVLQLLG